MKNIFKKVALFASALVLAIGLASCGEKDSGTGPYDSITRKLKLTKSYEGKNFMTGLIEEATLKWNTDGDTATFQTKNSDQQITIRFYSIDTPESTGGVEKWGKSASKFTAERLNAATSIILEAIDVDGAPGADADSVSGGARHLGYVWYKTAAYNEYKNLNLEIVENGYSENHGNPSSKFEYNDYFKEAQEFAMKKKLHIHGDEVDPNYSTDPVILNIKEIQEDLASEQCTLFHSDDANDFSQGSGAKVRILNAYVKELYIATSGTYTFTFAQVIDGVEYTFKVYAGYSSAPASKSIKVGSSYTITGTIQYHSGFQLSGLKYVGGNEGGDYVTLRNKDCYYIFSEKTYNQTYNANTALSKLTVTEVGTPSNSVITVKGTASGKTFTVLLPEATYSTVSVGDQLTISGCKNDAGQIVVVSLTK